MTLNCRLLFPWLLLLSSSVVGHFLRRRLEQIRCRKSITAFKSGQLKNICICFHLFLQRDIIRLWLIKIETQQSFEYSSELLLLSLGIISKETMVPATVKATTIVVWISLNVGGAADALASGRYIPIYIYVYGKNLNKVSHFPDPSFSIFRNNLYCKRKAFRLRGSQQKVGAAALKLNNKKKSNEAWRCSSGESYTCYCSGKKCL